MNSYSPRKPRNAPKTSKFTYRPDRGLEIVVIEATGVGKSYDDKILFEDMTFSLPPGGIVGVIGPNGAGKSTLFRMITGQERLIPGR